GQAPDLPSGAVVETNALFSCDRIEPVCAGSAPDGIRPLILRHIRNQENALTAALKCDRELGFSTFMNDPQMSAVSMKDGRALFDDMLENQRRFLPAAWF
ncbi:MAG: alpha-glucosidase/alpha-galactosidase, partial [Clostridiales bacterium]|nr:alpha-glucosidase/alpha-galactosidase [Clostridiales bacterium]